MHSHHHTGGRELWTGWSLYTLEAVVN